MAGQRNNTIGLNLLPVNELAPERLSARSTGLESRAMSAAYSMPRRVARSCGGLHTPYGLFSCKL